MNKQEKFFYAAGYYPLMHEEQDWEKDLKMMKDAGINLVRTAELFNTWDRIEPQEGNFNFDFLDRFFDLCSKYGIKILLGTGTASPPYWLHQKYEDVNILNNHGEQYPNNVSYSWACIDHQGYINESQRYITTLVNRYKNHDALYAYQLHNEISFPFMPLKDGDIDIYCYCNHTISKYQKWLKNKYQTLENLNFAYRWGATNTYHNSFEEVIPPKTKPTSWSSVTRWLDWRLFWMENIVNFIKWQNNIIKELDTNHPTSTNIFFLKSQDPLGVLTALDQFEMAKVVDYIGYDLYPGSGNKLEKKPEFSSMFLDMARSTSRYLNKDYWLLETESGPINDWVLGPSRNVKGFDIIRNVFEAIGHDTKLTLYQGWREWDFQPLHWGAIVDLDGNPTERTTAAGFIGQILKEHGDDLLNSNCPDSKIAILMSKENAIVLNGMGQENFLIKALRGAYRVFWEKNYAIEFISPEQVESGYANKYKAIYMPFLAVIDEKLAKGLSEYVSQGGLLIGAARAGMLGTNGWYNHQIPCYDLADVFGVKIAETYANVKPNITYNNKNYLGNWHKEILDITSNEVEVLARFNDDNPAVTLNTYNKGKALFFATHTEVAFLEDKSLLLWDILDDVLSNLDIEPVLNLDYSNRLHKEIDGHFLQGDNFDYIIFTNYVTQDHNSFFINGKKTVRIKLSTDDTYKTITNIVTNNEYDFKVNNNKLELSLEIFKNKITILKLEKNVGEK